MTAFLNHLALPMVRPGGVQTREGPVIDNETKLQLRNERDRYVAFAFAAADLLLEIDAEQRIITAIGASMTVAGRTASALVGIEVGEIVVPQDRGLVRRLIRNISSSGRMDPATIRCNQQDMESSLILFGGCVLPTVEGKVFLSLTILPDVLSLPDMVTDDATGLLNGDALLENAQRAAKDQPGRGPNNLTLIKLDGLSGAVRRLAPDRASTLMAEIGAALRAQSTSGNNAARLGEEEFGLVASSAGDARRSELLLKDIEDVVRASGISAGAIVPRLSKIALSVGDLNETDAAKSLAYAVTSFCKNNGRGPVTSLQDGLTQAMEDTVRRFGDLRSIIDLGTFRIVYQPVVSLKTRQVHHHEVLSRFPDGRNVFDMICFSEQIGLIQDLDLAVCQRAIAALQDTNGTAVAVNISGRSVQNEAFRRALTELTRPLPHLKNRLLFELTESSAVEEVDEAANFLRWLRRSGFPLCLDDFGSGAAAYSYLRRFDVDYVKVDGPFLRAAVTDKRERALVHSVSQLCNDLGCEVIGEMIEDEEMVNLALSMGMTLGQGWLFGRPVDQLVQQAPLVVGRRKGAVDSWQ